MTQRSLEIAWADYIAAERDRIRDVSMRHLAEVIGLALGSPERESRPWAKEVARAAIDASAPTPIRLPLFREVLFPVLLSGMRAGEPNCARWLAGFSVLLGKSPECRSQLAPSERGDANLLRIAIRTNPEDARAKSSLAKLLENQLDYSLHEIPAGVLYGRDGATVEQIRELQLELNEFEDLVRAAGTEDEHADLIEDCKFHFRAYADYLARRELFRSYKDYLAESGAA